MKISSVLCLGCTGSAFKERLESNIEGEFKKDHQRSDCWPVLIEKKVLFLDCGNPNRELCLSSHAWAQIVDQCFFTARKHSNARVTDSDRAYTMASTWKTKEGAKSCQLSPLTITWVKQCWYFPVTEQKILEAKIYCAACRESFQISKNEFIKELHIGSELGNTHFCFFYIK